MILTEYSKLPTYEEYECAYSNTGRLYSGKQFKTPKKPVNEKQLRTAYSVHIRKLKIINEKSKQKKDDNESLDQEIRNKCFERDRGFCQAVAIFNGTEFNQFKELSNGLEGELDAAHIFGKNAYPHMRYLLENVVLINRISHNWLDTGKSPVNGKQITVTEKEIWWKRIIGLDRYRTLDKISVHGVVK